MKFNKSARSFDDFELSQTFGTEYETDKDRTKRGLMEFMLLTTEDEVIVVDPEDCQLQDTREPACAVESLITSRIFARESEEEVDLVHDLY